MRYIGAISDTDILINLAKVDRLDILEYLFKQIIIPQYVYDVEIKKKAGKYYGAINHILPLNFLYFSPHSYIASRIGFRLSPSSVSVYSTFGGTSG